MRVFDHPQLIMHHSPMPAVTVGYEMADDPRHVGTGEPFVVVDGTQFRPFLFRLMLNLVALSTQPQKKDSEFVLETRSSSQAE